MINYRKLTLIIVIFLLVVSISVGVLSSKVRHNTYLDVKYDDSKELTSIPDDYIVDESFTSHLPIIVMETNIEEFIDDAYYDHESHRFLSETPADESFITKKTYIYDNENNNSLKDEPTITSLAKIRYRGNTSISYEKKQYLIKFVNEKDKSIKHDVFGMGENNSWVLNGSMIDKSMIRNYLAYNVSSQIMDAYIDSKFCELIIKTDEGYKYMGVFLMSENVEQGKNRIPIMNYKKKYAETGYLLRRDRYDDEEYNLDNYSREEDLAYGALNLKYPKKEEITDKSIKYIENDISTFEKYLYSNNPDEFIKYRELIDIDSFVDYYIINEFFGNYDAGFNSTYIYKQLGGKITYGPVWDFDGAMDNYKNGAFDYDATAFQNSPWFDRMLLDPYFCNKLESRYKELRKNVLSDENIENLIDDTVSYLGKAPDREWSRWKHVYYNSTYLKDGTNRHGELITNRNSNSHREEIEKIKKTLKQHANWLDKNTGIFYLNIDTVEGLSFKEIDSAYKNSKYYDDFDYGSFFGAIFIVVFMISIILIQRD